LWWAIAGDKIPDSSENIPTKAIYPDDRQSITYPSKGAEMFAIFNLGAQELIILFLMGVFWIGVPILALVVVLTLIRKKSRTGDPDGEMQLRSEVQRLREDVDRLKREATH
jgi:hypothetical protein